jgi:hypothetical protein
MRNRILIISVLAIALTLAAGVYAANQNSATGTANKNQVQPQVTNQGDDTQIQAQNQEQQNDEEGDQADDEGQNSNGQINAQEHRSAVANFVQNLLQVADREGGIGQQVRVIAQDQNQSSETTVQAMEQVQSRGRVMTFFFGPDYKNLGTLRSEMVQTRNRLAQLNRLVDSAQSESDKTELQNQIQTLEQEQTKIEDLISSKEDQFSLFGWLVKLFNK